MVTSNIKPAMYRFKTTKNGFVFVHDLERNFLEQIFPFERFQRDEDGVSLVIKQFAQKLQKRDLIRLADKLMALDVSNQMDWAATYLYIQRL